VKKINNLGDRLNRYGILNLFLISLLICQLVFDGHAISNHITIAILIIFNLILGIYELRKDLLVDKVE